MMCSDGKCGTCRSAWCRIMLSALLTLGTVWAALGDRAACCWSLCSISYHTQNHKRKRIFKIQLMLCIVCANMDFGCKQTCSCCRALTKAFFRRLVCSAFRAFFWLEVMHCSHRMRPLFSCFQWGVKSVLHWAQKNGSMRASEPLILPATTQKSYWVLLPLIFYFIYYDTGCIAWYFLSSLLLLCFYHSCMGMDSHASTFEVTLQAFFSFYTWRMIILFQYGRKTGHISVILRLLLFSLNMRWPTDSSASKILGHVHFNKFFYKKH